MLSVVLLNDVMQSVVMLNVMKIIAECMIDKIGSNFECLLVAGSCGKTLTLRFMSRTYFCAMVKLHKYTVSFSRKSFGCMSFY
jgi:hypothetical protein